MPDDILTPWYAFGNGEQRGRVDNNHNADILRTDAGYRWSVTDWSTGHNVVLASGTDADIEKARRRATAVLLVDAPENVSESD